MEIFYLHYSRNKISFTELWIRFRYAFLIYKKDSFSIKGNSMVSLDVFKEVRVEK